LRSRLCNSSESTDCEGVSHNSGDAATVPRGIRYLDRVFDGAVILVFIHIRGPQVSNLLLD